MHRHHASTSTFLRLRRHQGFTLLELLIVVAIIGLLASVMIPNFLDAMNKAKQKRSMMDMRHTGSAWLSWLTDQVGAASAGSEKVYDRSEFIEVSYTELHTHLRPSDTFFYMQEIPQKDAWQVPYRYLRHPTVGSSNGVMICAAAQDRVFGDCVAEVEVGGFLSTNYAADIVWADGYFVRWPVGVKDL